MHYIFYIYKSRFFFNLNNFYIKFKNKLLNNFNINDRLNTKSNKFNIKFNIKRFYYNNII